MIWNPVKVETCSFVKATGEELKLITTEKMSNETGEVKWFYRITSRHNPLPVKGEFESSFRVLSYWLQDQGWIKTPGKETIYFVERK